jgi:DNA-binding NarL/FixJ family response regulator
MGVLMKESPPAVLLKAIQKVVAGEFWLDRRTTASLLIDMRRDANRSVEKAPVNKLARLSEREREVVSLVGEGLRNKQIAERLRISESTVRHHLTSVFDKLEVSDRLELVVYSFQNGLLPSRA